MIYRKAIDHVCGEIAQVMYSCLKNRQMYDPVLPAEHLGVSLDLYCLDVRMPNSLQFLAFARQWRPLERLLS